MHSLITSSTYCSTFSLLFCPVTMACKYVGFASMVSLYVMDVFLAPDLAADRVINTRPHDYLPQTRMKRAGRDSIPRHSAKLALIAAMPAPAQPSSSLPPGAPDTPIPPRIEPPASINRPPPTATTPGRW